MIENVDNLLRAVFYNVQFNKTCHQNHLKKLKKCYERYNFDIFWNAFETCFRVPLTVGMRHPRVENTLQFVASFAASLLPCQEEETDTDEPMNEFLAKLFDFLLTNHSAKDASVRFRICHFLNILMNSMGQHAFIDEELSERIIAAMMNRLLDKSAKVRAQAIFSLQRLQDPTDDQCQIITAYSFHASKDPKPEVRRAVLLNMAKNQKTLQVAIKRTRDINETVRKLAYEFISRITVRSLTIKQRDQVLSDGLRDRSEIVQKTVKNVLLPSWLRHFNGDFVTLARSLDAEIGTDTTTLALQTLFKETDMNRLLEQVPVDKESKLIPIPKLSSENSLYWKCLVNHLHRDGCTEELDKIIPELSNFCAYISDFLAMMSAKMYERWEVHTQMFILLQLFEITQIYELTDEVGRKKLNDLICNTLMTDHCSEKLIESMVTHLEKIVPNTNTRLSTLTNIISEIRLPMKETQVVTQISEKEQRELDMQKAKVKVKILQLAEEEYQAIKAKDYLKANDMKLQISALNEELAKLTVEQPKIGLIEDSREEKNDPKTMIKCLTIMCTMIQPVTSLTPTLRSVMQIALESLNHANDNVHILALRAIGIYCLLDKQLAKERIMSFFLQFTLEQENIGIWIISLKAIFDLLLMYGLEYFDIMENTEESSREKSRTVKLYSNQSETNISLTSASNSSTADAPNCNFLKILAGLLDHQCQDLRTVATEGLCKLLLNRRISSPYLLSRLIVLCYNPANNDDSFMRQCLSVFFDQFVIRVPDGQQMLEAAYLPTLRIISSAPDISPLTEIELYDVSLFILSLTRHDLRKPGIDNYCSHNNLVFSILSEVLSPNSKIDQETLIKSLKALRVDIVESTAKHNLLEALDKVTEMVNETDKRLLRYIDAFKKQLLSPTPIVVGQEEEDDDDEKEDDDDDEDDDDEDEEEGEEEEEEDDDDDEEEEEEEEEIEIEIENED